VGPIQLYFLHYFKPLFTLLVEEYTEDPVGLFIVEGARLFGVSDLVTGHCQVFWTAKEVGERISTYQARSVLFDFLSSQQGRNQLFISGRAIFMNFHSMTSSCLFNHGTTFSQTVTDMFFSQHFRKWELI